MSQVSRLKVKNNIYEGILRNLFLAISKVNREESTRIFLDDLLTRTEKIVLAKRLAIALLLESGKSYSEIGDIVKVSASTISNVSNKLSSGSGYKEIVRKLNSLEIKKENSWLVDLLTSKANTKARNRIFNRSN